MSEFPIAPQLTTARLILRGHREDDLDAAAALWANASVVRHITGAPSSRQESWKRVLSYAGHWSLKGYGYWAVVEAASGLFIGEVGLADFKRRLIPPIHDAPETGWVIAPSHQSQGFGREAMEAVLEWSDNVLKPDRTVCLIHPSNAISQRLAAKLGYRAAPPSRYADGAPPPLVFERWTPDHPGPT